MKQWREYYCSENDFWEILTDSKTLEFEGDACCKDGHKAVIRRRMRPGDQVVVDIIPAARQMDAKSEKIGLSNRFYLRVEALLDGWSRISSLSFEKNEILTLVEIFVGLESQAALRAWDSKGLGTSQGYRINKQEHP